MIVFPIGHLNLLPQLQFCGSPNHFGDNLSETDAPHYAGPEQLVAGWMAGSLTGAAVVVAAAFGLSRVDSD